MRTPLIILLVYSFLGVSLLAQQAGPGASSHPGFSERVTERERMVREHIAQYPYHPVQDPEVLAAMRRVPRHLFIPAENREFAYLNSPVPIGYQQTISQPVIVAHMTELLDIQPEDRILEIGTGSGYQAAILGELCKHVFTMEIIVPLGKRADTLLKELGYDHVKVRIGNGYEGWPEEAPFDKIIVTCAPDQIPQPLLEQLAPGGKMVIPVGSQSETQYLVEVRKNLNGKISRKKQYPVRFVPMTGKKKE